VLPSDYLAFYCLARLLVQYRVNDLYYIVNGDLSIIVAIGGEQLVRSRSCSAQDKVDRQYHIVDSYVGISVDITFQVLGYGDSGDMLVNNSRTPVDTQRGQVVFPDDNSFSVDIVSKQVPVIGIQDIGTLNWGI
jgi:hypothetical protein